MPVDDRVDWRSQEFQALLNIRPIKVTFKADLDTDDGSKLAATGPEGVSKGPPDIIEYFGLPHPKEMDPGLVEDIFQIGKMILRETKDPDEVFLILQSTEKLLPKTTDPILRVERMKRILRGFRRDGTIKGKLTEEGALDLVDVEEHAKESGNWRRFLKMAEKQDQAVRR